jgi:uncharacterized membrane protein
MRGCTCHGPALCPWCTALAQRAGVLAPVEAPALSEAAWQAAVVRMATAAGFMCYHTWDARRSPSGWP